MPVSAPAIAFVVGTRPEAIKLAPVILRARQNRALRRTLVINTAQQADLIGTALCTFGIRPDIELQVMQPGQPLNCLLARSIDQIGTAIRSVSPALVVVQGDTTTALAGALAAFQERIAVAHIEAGLRTGNIMAPFPEEANRQLISRIAQLHFAPTVDAKARLLSEGIDAELIEVTGNTIVDAIRLLTPSLASAPDPLVNLHRRRLVLVTAHRRENLGKPLESICDAVRQLARTCEEIEFVVIQHPNPVGARIVQAKLTGRKRITLLPPQPYLAVLRILSAAWLVVTDSGGLQEEAPSFGKPVLVLRQQTERVESLTLGCSRLVGTSKKGIIAAVTDLLFSPDAYQGLVPDSNPYGDGHAAARIVERLAIFLGTRRSRIAA
jgi:UDP-N-acetylglucosamine 2-epimerase